MKEGNAIEVKNIAKSFKVYLDRSHNAKDFMIHSNRRKYEYRKVLKGISFEIKKGEAVGLIGHNGCGKSTTLKLLARIMYPDSGTIEMKGRVSSLIELGAGFHPDMSGRENVYINASIFGLSKKEIDSRMDDIIAFSELEDFIDSPVRTYSSGMYMRLAFSVAISVDADILLIDEILAVGDANFQAKCFNRLREIKSKGTTIVIVSHSLGQIEQICEKTIWIQDGLIKSEGAPRNVHPEYLDFMGEKRQEIAEKENERKKAKHDKQAVNTEESIKDHQNDYSDNNKNENKDENKDGVAEKASVEEKKRWGNGKARIEKISIINNKGKEQVVFKTGESIKIQIQYIVQQMVEDAVFGIGIFRSDGLQCYGTNTRIDKLEKFDLNKDGIVSVEIDELNLLAGEYLLDVAVECNVGIAVDYYRECYRFEVYSDYEDVGVTRLNHNWIL